MISTAFNHGSKLKYDPEDKLAVHSKTNWAVGGGFTVGTSTLDLHPLPLQSLSSPGRRSPLPPRSWGSRRSSWNSLGRAPSLKRRDTSGERESLLSGEGREEEDEDEDNENKAEVADNSLLRPEPLELLQASTLCPALVVEYGDCNGRTLTYDPNLNSESKEDSLPEDDLDDDVRIQCL